MEYQILVLFSIFSIEIWSRAVLPFVSVRRNCTKKTLEIEEQQTSENHQKTEFMLRWKNHGGRMVMEFLFSSFTRLIFLNLPSSHHRRICLLAYSSFRYLSLVKYLRLSAVEIYVLMTFSTHLVEMKVILQFCKLNNLNSIKFESILHRASHMRLFTVNMTKIHCEIMTNDWVKRVKQLWPHKQNHSCIYNRKH